VISPEIFPVVRSFCLVVAMLLVVRNLSWIGVLVAAYLKAGVDGVREEWSVPSMFPQGIVRLGTATLCLMTITAFLIPSIQHRVDWLSGDSQPAMASVSILCLAVLLVWRWMHFAQQFVPAIWSLVLAFALAVLLEYGVTV